MEWKNKTLKKISISAKADGKTTLINGNKEKEIFLKNGQTIDIDW
jgi:hypothetical protein